MHHRPYCPCRLIRYARQFYIPKHRQQDQQDRYHRAHSRHCRWHKCDPAGREPTCNVSASMTEVSLYEMQSFGSKEGVLGAGCEV